MTDYRPSPGEDVAVRVTYDSIYRPHPLSPAGMAGGTMRQVIHGGVQYLVPAIDLGPWRSPAEWDAMEAVIQETIDHGEAHPDRISIGTLRALAALAAIREQR